MKNKHAHRARVSEHQFRRLVRLFALDLDATHFAELNGLNRNTVNRYLHLKESVSFTLIIDART